MLTTLTTWAELQKELRIITVGEWRKSVNMRRGRKIEAQAFSSSSLSNVYSMGAFSIIRAGASIGGARIGRFAAIGANFVCAAPEHPSAALGMSSVFLKDYEWAKGGDGFYTVPRSGEKLVTRAVTIGNDVWVGRDVYVKGGVQIGDGAIVAARSVVTHDVPPYTIVAGTPARVVRSRFPERIVRDLLELRWWNLDPAWMSSVNQSNIEECVDFLLDQRKVLPALAPRSVRFADDGYEVL